MKVDEVLQRAMTAYSTGTLGQAELLFNQVLAADKQQFDALHMLGILQSRRRNYAEAVRLITRAIEMQPRSAQAHSHCPVVAHRYTATRSTPQSPLAGLESLDGLPLLVRVSVGVRH